MVDTLLKYVEEQLGKGYKPDSIKNSLVRQGYSPSLVESVIDSVMMKQPVGGPKTVGVSHAKTAFPKLIFLVIFLALAIVGVIFVPGLINKDALLDIAATPDKPSFAIGEDLGFDVEIYNMGSADEFDIALKYRLLDSRENTILSREETVAISTSTSHHRSIELPSNTLPGDYTLRVFANYKDKVATSSFSFSVTDKPIATKETCTDGIKNQNEIGPDCGGVCRGYWYDGKCNTKPKDGPVTKETCTDGKKNQNEIGPDCGGVCGGYWYNNKCNTKPKEIIPPDHEPSFAEMITNARDLAKSNPNEAKNICLDWDVVDEKDKCLKIVAQTASKKEYCELISDDNTRDSCYYPFFMQGDYSVCEKLTNPKNKETCELLRALSLSQE